MSSQIVGYSPHRLRPDDDYFKDEVKLNEIFNLFIDRDPNFWDFMTGCNDRGTRPDGHLSERELRIVATTIQWLGTPVGKGFLRESGIIE